MLLLNETYCLGGLDDITHIFRGNKMYFIIIMPFPGFYLLEAAFILEFLYLLEVAFILEFLYCKKKKIIYESRIYTTLRCIPSLEGRVSLFPFQ